VDRVGHELQAVRDAPEGPAVARLVDDRGLPLRLVECGERTGI
jgi:hypothetical protein